ncbi:MAG: VCBS repeat-containing protein [Planctomycetes bacterium]|nr:VCBS repeat-containing protein [Planctomycetota bacterium]MBI3843648.1 VCBS repeat-containing protein [Planctomycetota bacterium]
MMDHRNLCACVFAATSFAASAANAGDFSFGSPLRIVTGLRPVAADAEDLNGDGFEDLLIANSGSDSISVLFGDGLGNFAPPMTFPSGDKAWSLDLGHVDDDPFDDLVVACGNSNAVAVHFGHGDGTFDPPVFFPVGRFPRWASLVDLDGDGRLDILVSNYGGDDMSELINLGGRQFATEVRMPSGLKPAMIMVGDVNGDSRPDVVFSNRASDNIWIWFASPAGGFDAPTIIPVGRRPYAMGAGDFNGDGVLDLVTVNINSRDASILFGDGHGGFLPHVDYPTNGRRSAAIAVFDADGDGDLDLACANIDSNDITILENDGHGVFTDAMHLNGLQGALGAYVEDFDRDGAPDLVATNLDGAAVSIYGNLCEMFVRHGTVNCGAGTPADVLFVNGSSGDFQREMPIGHGQPVVVRMDAPPAGPVSARFAVYGWGRAPHVGSVVTLDHFAGRIIFPIAGTGGRPQPRVVANNLGFPNLFGIPTRTSSPAPTVLMDHPEGIRGPRDITIQGFIEDAAARTPHGVSVTNAIVLHVE